MKTRTRLSAFFLALCLLVSMIVPAVYAEEETVKITYDFDYYNVMGGKNLGSNNALNEKCASTIQKNYNNGTFNWFYTFGEIGTEATDVQFRKQGYMRLKGTGWMAFTIDNPGAGTEWTVTMRHVMTKYGTADLQVYIIPAETKVEDIPGLLTEANKIGSVNEYSKDEATYGSDVNSGAPTTTFITSEIGKWTAGDAETYKIVFKNDDLYLYLSQIYMEGVPVTEKEEEDQYMETTVKYDYDYYNVMGGANLGSNNAFSEKCAATIQKNYNSGKFNWFYTLGEIGTEATDVQFRKQGYMRIKGTGWMAFTFDNPGAGTEWTVTMRHVMTKYGTKGLQVYIIPAETKVEDIPGLLTEANKIGSVNEYSKDEATYGSDVNSGTPTTTFITSEVGKWTAGDAETYKIVFKNDDGYLYLSQVFMTGMIKVEEEEPEPPEEDVDPGNGGFDGGNGTLPVLSQIAREAAVDTIRCTYAATDIIDGHDIMYMFFNGASMFVYDLDTNKLIDTKRDVQGTPRGVYIDENHTVWVIGSTNMLYRYNPFTKESERIEIPWEMFPVDLSFNAHGITGDGNGTLYFGTCNRVYIGKYDIATGTFTRISEELTTDGHRAGYAGMILKDGYAYLGVDGNKNTDDEYTHWIIKYDLEKQEIVDKVVILDELGKEQYLEYLNLVGDKYLFGSTGKKANSVIIDISGERMKKIPVSDFKILDAQDPDDLTKATGLPGIIGDVLTLNGKAYFMGPDNMGMLAFDIATETITKTGIPNNLILRCYYGGIVTIDGLEGESLVTFSSVGGAETVDLVFYNPATGKTVTKTNYTKGRGSGNQLRTLEMSEDGSIIYVGAYGTNKVIGYEVATGKKAIEFFTTSHQTEGLILYKGSLYVGNYGYCSISKYDPATGKGQTLSQINITPFYQNRIHPSDAGDDKVFFGTAPGQGRLGGVLMWYDIQLDRIYVAAGPDTENVFYTTAGDTTNKNWYSAATEQKVDFDYNGDGKVDSNDSLYPDGTQRYTGVITNQSPNNIIYKNGYIIGSTSRYGGSGAQLVDNNNAVLFVYDVEAKKVVCTYDVAKSISGLKVPVEWIDAMEADPEVEGKYWGVVSDTLFSFYVDAKNGEISNVKEEKSWGKEAYLHGGNTWDSRDILFDGDFMYVVIPSIGLFMIERENVNNCTLIMAAVPDADTRAVPKRMVQAADGNIYFICNNYDLLVLNVANALNAIKDENGVAKVSGLINALDSNENITLEDEAAVLKARFEYEKLSAAAKAKIDTAKLTEAEAVIKPLREAADKEAVENTIKLIDSIGTVTLDSEPAIVAARTAYDALTETQMTKITNYGVLTDAEAMLAYLKIPAEDKAAAAAVVAKIDALGAITIDGKAEIEAVRAAYNGLTDLQKSLVTNLEKLTAAEKLYEKLAAAAETVFNFSYQTACTELGLGLGTNNLLNANFPAKIEQYYKSGYFNWYYKAVSSTLTNAQFTPDGNLMLRSKPGDWAAFVIDNPGEGIWKLSMNHFATHWGAEEMGIYILPADTADIAAALTDANLIQKISCYDPNNVTTNMDKPVADTIIKGTELGYWKSGSDEKYIIVFKCEKASEAALADHAAAENPAGFGSNLYISQVVMNLVDEEIIALQEKLDSMIKVEDVTLQSEAEIAVIREAYEALGNYQKSQVDISKLEAAEAKLAELKAAADKVAADAVIVSIDAIGTVTLESRPAITDARAAYEALTTAQKSLVTNIDVLKAAEESLAVLESPKTGEVAVLLFVGLMVISAAAAFLLSDLRKKRINH